MYSHVLEWMNLVLRWIHIVAGIAWIGSSFFFMWLDAALEAPKSNKHNVVGELWMTHSGGFYQVEKRKIGPGEMPAVLHWFKWEAFFTWLTGIFLLLVVYYFTGGIYLVDESVAAIEPLTAMGIGIGLIILSWIVYDTLFNSKLAEKSKLSAAIAFVLLAAVTHILSRYLSGRAAYVHVGAILGTLMVGNVWMRILPNQRKMIEATERGEVPDFSLGEKAKRRSVHNNYMTFPIIFIMFSNHFPSTYGHELNWLVLLLVMLAGAGVKHVMNVGRDALWVFVPVAVLVGVLFNMTSPTRGKPREIGSSRGVSSTVTFEDVKAIVSSRCIACHSANPSDATFGPSPAGVHFDDEANIRKFAERIKIRVVDLKNMPFGNKTEMTDEERAKIGEWIHGGMP